MVFADNPEEDPPAPGDAGVTVISENADLANARIIYFPPGLHNLFDYVLDGRLILHDDQSVYIPGGAYVYGTLFGASSHNIKLSGRGILSGNMHEFHYDGMRQLAEFDTYNTILNIRRGSHHTLEGITLIESVNHTLVVPQKSLVKDVKFISWACNNDGLRSGDDCVIDHVFMKLCDDYFYATSTSVIKRCVLWPMFNGATLQLGWGANKAGGTRFLHNEIINPEWDWIGSNTGFIASQVKPGANISDLLVEDLHIDGNINALVHLDYALVPGREYNWKGSIRDFTFRNVELDGRQIWYSSRGWDDYERLESQLSSDYNIDAANPAVKGRSIIRGMENEDGEIVWVENIHFENLKINGEWISQENHEKYFDIDPRTTRNISFTLDAAVEVLERPGPTSLSAYLAQGYGAGSVEKEAADALKSGWLGEGDQFSFNIDLPAENEYEIRYGIVPIYGPATLSITAGKNHTGSIEVDAYKNNAFRNIKNVHVENFVFKRGKQKVHVTIEKGQCIPDLLEIVPASEEKGSPEYRVFTHWHGILRKSPTNWKAAELGYSLEKDSITFYNRAKSLEGCEISAFDMNGKKVAKNGSGKLLPSLDISNLSPGPHWALITDGSSWWAVKQFVIY